MNDALAVTLTVLLLIVPIIVGALVYMGRKNLREAKNFERGLKMIPLLIHLPPSSDDITGENRDERDVADEDIFKAQTLYSILSSTLTKGFKASLYGQRHISLEIVAHNGKVYFYTAVPVAMVSVVEQAVLGAYPNSRLEEVEEHNIFSPVGKSSGTVGGELVLKKSFIYPIATYQDIKRDSMQALLNALASLDKEDGAGIQILLRPTNGNWVRKSKKEALKLKDGKVKSSGILVVFEWLGDAVTALVKPPEEKNDSPDKPVSGVDQARAEAVEEKAGHTGYEVLIRIVASSNISHRSQQILSNIVAVFSMYNAEGKNGFKFVPASDVDNFVMAYVLRFFPAESKKNILNDVELATIFHLPDSGNVPTTQLDRQQSKQVDGPRNMLDEGLLLGYNVFRGAKKPIRLSENDRRRHVYLVGQTGTGKSTFIENLAVQDMLEGRGFAFVDPHGDSAEKLLGMVPKERTEDIIYFCPAEMDYPMGLNLFEYDRDKPEQKDFLIQEVIGMLYKLYDPDHQGIVGPRLEHIFRNCALLLMADPAGGTFIDIPKLLVDYDYAKQKLKYTNDRTVLDFWLKEFPNSQRSNDAGEVTAWVVSKFGAFISNTMMRNIIGQNKSSFDMRKIMDDGKILIVNLSKGRTGELNSKLLGMIFVMKFQAAAMSRADIPEAQRRDFCLYVDEFQNFASDSFGEIMSEARKYRLNLIVANQFTTQLEEKIRDAIFGNMGTVISHRVGNNDAEVLEKYYKPVFDTDDLQQLPNFNTIVKMLIGGVPTQPFSMASIPPLGHENKKLAAAMKQLSWVKYGQPKAEVEKIIFERLTTKETAKPAIGGGPGGPGGAFGKPGLPAGAPGAPSKSKSFLDDWLAKRKAQESAKKPAGGLPSKPVIGTGAPSSAPSAPGLSPKPVSTPTPASLTPMQKEGAQKPLQPSAEKDQPKPIVPAAKAVPTEKQPSADEKVVSASNPKADDYKTPKKGSEGTGNISSRSLDNEEVDSIAKKLKENLKKENPDKEMDGDVELGDKKDTDAGPKNDKVVDDEPKKVASGDSGFLSHDDTIHIDNEGNFSSS